RRTAKPGRGETARNWDMTRASGAILRSSLCQEIMEIAAIWRDFLLFQGSFLCRADCVAERSGFEPSIPIIDESSRNVGQMREIFSRKPAQRKMRVSQPGLRTGTSPHNPL